MTIARILGDFTDWVPVTMHMHQVKDIQVDPAKKGEFFVKVKLVKGFRYRYKFEIDGAEVIDDKSLKSRNTAGELTNYLEVMSVEEGNMTV